jgi:squalene synthase HpnC/squalene synthase HpnD
MAYSFAKHLARFGPDARIPPMDISQARSYCARLTRSHYENFTVASALLPRRLLPHFFPVYAYCRWADDLGDETGGGDKALELLNWWRRQLLDCYAGKATHPVMIALQPTIKRFAIPPEPFLDLISAFEQDQRIKRYRTFYELLDYCRRSANPVGRLVLYLCESFDEERPALSDQICTGLQLANHWQDVRRDYVKLGRVYLPECDRREFGYADDDLNACRFTPQFRELMRSEVDRARGFLERGRPLIGLVPSDVGIDIELFLEGGLAILRRIEAIDYDVWKTRPEVSKREKAGLLLSALRSNIGGRVLSTPYSVRSNGRPADTRYPIRNTRSYAWCRRLARRTARNFYYAFYVLPKAQRRAMDALYAFMRVTDDLADEPGDVEAKQQALRDWRSALDHALAGDYSHPLHPALHETVRRYGIPVKHLHDVIDGVEMDLQPVRFATFAELYAYCYRVASAVGLACIHIWGFEDDKAKEYAEAAGIAFQLTNILRDVGEDLHAGRVYIPQEDIYRFGCPPESWRERGEAFQKLMRFQAERARSYYAKAEGLDRLLTDSGRSVFRVMLRIYRGLLDKIEARGFDVFSERVRLSRWRKLRHLLSAFPVRWGWL